MHLVSNTNYNFHTDDQTNLHPKYPICHAFCHDGSLVHVEVCFQYHCLEKIKRKSNRVKDDCRIAYEALARIKGWMSSDGKIDLFDTI